MVEPPTRFSTTICWPRRSPILIATVRAMVSELEPAENGTIILIGRSGHSARAALPPMRVTATKAKRNADRIASPPLLNLLGLAQAFKQRGPQQELACQIRIFSLPPQLVVVTAGRRRQSVALAERVAGGCPPLAGH